MSTTPNLEVSDVSPSAIPERLARVLYMRGFQLECEHFGNDKAILVLPALAHLRSSCGTYVEEAAIASVLDQLGSVAIWGRFGLWYPHATTSLSVSFFQRAPVGPIQFEGRVVEVVGGLCHTSLVAISKATGAVLAQGISSFMMGSYAAGTPPPESRERHDEADRISAPSFLEYVGAVFDGDECTLPFRRMLIGSPDPETLHGGAIISGALASIDKRANEMPTQELKALSVEFLKGGKAVDTVFSARVIQRGRRSSTYSAEGVQLGDRKLAFALARYGNFT